jgi:transposase
MDKDKQGHIRFLFKQKKKNISQISRETEVSRNTVRNLISRKEGKKPKKRISKLDDYKDEIQSMLSEKPGLSNVLILEKLKQKGYQGSRSILGEYILLTRGPQAEAYFNLETLPGREAQADWAHCGEISCGKHKRKLYMFCMVMSFSRYLYIEFTTSMNFSTFLCCHINAFNFFGGVPQSILYDNLKSVVRTRLGSKITYNGHFLDFASWYGFNPKACNPRSGNEKGKVERVIQYVRNNFITGYQYDHPQSNFDHIKAQSMIWLVKTANRREHSVTHKIPAEYFLLEENKHLLPLPENPYDYADTEPKPVSKDCLVVYDTNRYSVPSENTGQTVILKAYSGTIKIINSKQEEITSHKRCYDKYCAIKNPDHYKELFERKKKAQHSSRREIFTALCPEAIEYLEGLNQEHPNPDYHVEKILSYAGIYGRTATAGAIARATGYKAFGWEYIKNILLKSGTTAAPNTLTNLLQRKDLFDIEIDAHDLESYDNMKLS